MPIDKIKFSGIFLQDKAISHLTASIRRGRISQTYLFTGRKSVGKNRVATAFSAALQCLEPRQSQEDVIADACGKCLSCKRIFSRSHPDVTSITPLGSDIRIDQVRTMQNLAQLHPYLGKWRIFIINPADRLNEFSANSLLKILEEAPEKVIFILLAENSDRILATIKSRAEIINFESPTHDKAREVLVQNSEQNPERIISIYSLAEGSFGKALSLSEQPEDISYPLTLRESHEKFLACFDDFTETIENHFANATSLEEIIKALEESENLISLPLLGSRKGFIRGLTMAEKIPQAFPLLFSQAFLDKQDRMKKRLNKKIDGLLSREKQAYSAGVLREIEDQIHAIINTLVNRQTRDFSECLLNWLEDAFRYGCTNAETILLNLDRKEDIMRLAKVRGENFVQSLIIRVSKSLELMERNVQPSLILENVLTGFGGSIA